MTCNFIRGENEMLKNLVMLAVAATRGGDAGLDGA